MLEIYRNPVVPILRRHLFGRVPFVMRRVVDEDRDRPVDLAGFRDARAQRGDIRDVDMRKVSGKSLAGKLPRETDARLSAISKKTTVDFWRAKPRTIASPMPDAPPVTSTTLPARSG